MAFIAVAGSALFGGGVFGSLAFNAILGVGMIGLSYWMQSRQHSYGPRMENLEVSDLPVGAPVALNYGMNAWYATCMWIKDNKLIEKSKTERQGKGGPKVTTYSYYLTGAFSIADNEQLALIKCWANDKVIIDNSYYDPAEALTLENPGSLSGIVTKDGVAFTLYLGTETQMPDPLMEAVFSVGSTPAYRGLCYIVFNELPLEDLGNAVPQIRVQMIADNAVAVPAAKGPQYGPNRQAALGQKTKYAYSADVANDMILKYDLATGILLASAPSSFPMASSEGIVADQWGRIYVSETGTAAVTGFNASVGVYDANTLLEVGRLIVPSAGAITSGLSRVWSADGEIITCQTFSSVEDPITGDHWMGYWITNTETPPTGNPDKHLFCPGSIDNFGADTHHWTSLGTRGWGMGPDGNTPILTAWNWGPKSGAGVKTYDLSSEFTNRIGGLGYYPDEDAIIIWGMDAAAGTSRIRINKYSGLEFEAGTLEKIDEGFIDQVVTGGTLTFGQWAGKRQAYESGYLIIGDNNNSDYLYRFSLAFMQVIETVYIENSEIGTYRHGTYIPEMNAAILYPDSDESSVAWTGNNDATMIFFGRWTVDGVTIKEIFDDWNSRLNVPVSPTRFDTDDLANEYVVGFTWIELSPIAEAFGDIMRVWGIDLADWGDRLKFILRGSQTPITIPIEDLGAAEGPDEAEDNFIIEVAEGFNMPKHMTLKHWDPNAEFEASIQEASRQSAVVSSLETSELTTRLVLTADSAASKLQDIFKATWRQRTTYQFPLPQRYKQYAPGDVFQITKDGYTHEMLVEEITFDPAVIEVKASKEDVTDWDNSVTGISTQVSPQIITQLADPLLYMLDINALRDEDVDGLHYLAHGPQDAQDEYGGVVVLKGNTAETIEEWLAFTTVVPRGTIVQPPVAVPYPQMVDYASALQVYINPLFGFQPDSATIEQLQNDRTLNPALIVVTGPDTKQEVEFIQYASAVEISTNIWELTELIRGKRGTEFLVPYSANTTGGQILFPTATNIFREGLESEVGLQRYYQAVSIGATLPSTNPIFTFTNTAKSLRPYAPEHLSGIRDKSTETLTIDWKRRAITDGRWIDGQDVPLEFTQEEYNLYIYEDDTKASLLRTENIIGSSLYAYTLANYNSDASASETAIPQVYVAVGQVGDDYGEGILLEGYV